MKRLRTDSEIVEALLNSTPLIDVRAPVEFEAGTLPGAVNIPLLDDTQRAAVGTCYKNKGPDAAVQLGASLISGETRRLRIESWAQRIKAHPDSILFCFRGGMRSQLVQKALMEVGIEVPIIEGGFKRARGLLAAKLSSTLIATGAEIRVLSGLTGAGKSEALRAAASKNKIRFLDLENLAEHRGSSFGLKPAPQPGPVNFENSLSCELLRLTHQNDSSTPLSSPLWIEDESKTIGRLVVPPILFQLMQSAPVDVVERPRSVRAQRLTSEYLSENFGLVDGRSPESGSFIYEQALLQALERIQKRLGGLRYRAILDLAQEAFLKFRTTGLFSEHWAWVEALLEFYYDPLYSHHLDQISSRIQFQGPVEAWLQMHSPV